MIETPIFINPWAEAESLAADQTLALDISKHLTRHYPGWPWAVQCDSRTGMVYVCNFALSEKNGFNIRMSDIDTPHAIKTRAVWAGGEFLERWNLPRGKAQDGVIHEQSARAAFR